MLMKRSAAPCPACETDSRKAPYPRMGGQERGFSCRRQGRWGGAPDSSKKRSTFGGASSRGCRRGGSAGTARPASAVYRAQPRRCRDRAPDRSRRLAVAQRGHDQVDQDKDDRQRQRGEYMAGLEPPPEEVIGSPDAPPKGCESRSPCSLRCGGGRAVGGSDDPQPAEFSVVASRLGNLDRNPDFEGWRRPDQAGDPRPQLQLTVNGPACASGGRYSWTLNGQPLGVERLGGLPVLGHGSGRGGRDGRSRGPRPRRRFRGIADLERQRPADRLDRGLGGVGRGEPGHRRPLLGGGMDRQALPPLDVVRTRAGGARGRAGGRRLLDLVRAAGLLGGDRPRRVARRVQVSSPTAWRSAPGWISSIRSRRGGKSTP